MTLAYSKTAMDGRINLQCLDSVFAITSHYNFKNAENIPKQSIFHLLLGWKQKVSEFYN